MKRRALLGPRHNEIKKFLARSICRNLSVPVPPGD